MGYICSSTVELDSVDEETDEGEEKELDSEKEDELLLDGLLMLETDELDKCGSTSVLLMSSTIVMLDNMTLPVKSEYIYIGAIVVEGRNVVYLSVPTFVFNAKA
jgi:hypothetical protein